MVRRINPRHCTEVVQIRAASSPDGFSTVWAAQPVTVRAQVEETRQIITDDRGVTAATLMTVRVPASATPDVRHAAPLDSEITYDGGQSWVIATRAVQSQGQLVYLEVTTGDRQPRFGGWQVTAVLERTGGYNADGDPIPAQSIDVPASVIVPGDSREPVDRDSGPETKATWVVPTTLRVVSTDRVRILTSPMAGRWLVDGDPEYHPTRTVVHLRKG